VYSGVDVGYEQPSIDFQLYRQQFCEKLNYAAQQKRGDKQFNLVVSKLRADYAGIAITYYQQSQKKGGVTKKYLTEKLAEAETALAAETTEYTTAVADQNAEKVKAGTEKTVEIMQGVGQIATEIMSAIGAGYQNFA
jgi:hypothetical protein